MPRPSWTLKNRYCLRSKLSEEAFEGLLFDFFANRSAQESAQSLKEKYGAKLSRQGVNKYFLNLGYYAFLQFYVPDALLLLLAPVLEEKGLPEEIARERRWFFSYSLEFANTLLSAARITPGERDAVRARLLDLPQQVRRYLEQGTLPAQEVIESTPQGAVLVRLRDNQFLVSALRMMKRRSFGFTETHYLSYFGKAYFMDAFAMAYEHTVNDERTLENVWAQIGMRLPLTTYLRAHPMTLREPSAYPEIIARLFAD